MKKIRIVARLDIKGPNVVKGYQFECLRAVGRPADLAEEYYLQGADELVYLDTVANLYRRDSLIEIIHRASERFFIPFTVGGGIKDLDDIVQILKAGADKVAINTAATKNPALLLEAAQMFGSQCIVSSIEAKRVGDGRWESYVDNGRQKTGLDTVEWAKKVVKMGAGEILLTSVDKEGARQGMDHELIRAVAQAVSIPVIAAGGASSLEDFSRCVKYGGADAIATATLLHYRKYGVNEIKDHLENEGVSVRRVADPKKVVSDFTPRYNPPNYNAYTTLQMQKEYVNVGERVEEDEWDLSYGVKDNWAIGVIDYDINNVKSMVKAFEGLGRRVRRITTPEEILISKALVLPGVGAFEKGMNALKSKGFMEPIRKKVQEGTPLLGVCLGMQLLFTESEEFGLHKGLDLIPGRVVSLRSPEEVNDKGYRIPHIGWNSLDIPSFCSDKGLWNGCMLAPVPQASDVYFIHTYYAKTEPRYVMATTKYGGQEFPVVVKNGNIEATQFHPERSGEIGIKLLKGFCKRYDL